MTLEINKKQNKETPLIFKNERGEELAGVLHLPREAKPPLVVMCHGFDGSKTDKKYVQTARVLREEGIAAFRFDFEGCGDSQGKFEEMTVAKEVSDLDSALKAVLKEADLDSKRIALLGGSLGAVISALYVKNFKIPVKSLVFWSQAFNQKELFNVWHTAEEIAKWKKEKSLVKGDKKMGISYLEENIDKDYSFLLSEIDLPILLIQGEKDKDVPSEFSQKLAQEYKNIELKTLLEADHKFANPAVREELTKITVDWLKKYL